MLVEHTREEERVLHRVLVVQAYVPSSLAQVLVKLEDNITIAEKFVLFPVPYNDECTTPAFLALGLLCSAPLLSPATFDLVQGRQERLADKIMSQPVIVSIVQLKHPERVCSYVDR